jgi:hypothetical protein
MVETFDLKKRRNVDISYAFSAKTEDKQSLFKERNPCRD